MKFQVQTGYGVTVHRSGGLPPIRIHVDAPYETDDQDEIDLLRQQPGVIVSEEPVEAKQAPKRQTKRAKPKTKGDK
jgi:hypothetical protein